MDPSNMWKFVVLLILLFFSAFFSASETALMSLNKIRIRHMSEEKVRGAELVERLISQPNKLLGTILVGNNIVNIGASALATSLALEIYGSKGVVIATGVMTVLVLIFGEITPKSFAAQFPEKVSLKIIQPISGIVTILSPIVSVLSYVTTYIMQLFGIKVDKLHSVITEEELRTIVTVSQEEGVLEVEEKQMIHNVFEFGDSQIKDVMIQRTDIVAININAPYEEIVEIIKNEQFSRYPIYDDGIDNIVGILNVRDLLFIENKNKNFNIEEYIRKPYFSFEFKKISDIFKDMKKSRVHMAIVLDEYGGTAGVITIEDLIEEIVGDIHDEYDEFDNDIQYIKDSEYIVNGSTKLTMINDVFGTEFNSEDFDSIGGLIIETLGRLPNPGEKVECDNVKLVVESVERNRVLTIKVYI